MKAVNVLNHLPQRRCLLQEPARLKGVPVFTSRFVNAYTHPSGQQGTIAVCEPVELATCTYLLILINRGREACASVLQRACEYMLPWLRPRLRTLHEYLGG